MNHLFLPVFNSLFYFLSLFCFLPVFSCVHMYVSMLVYESCNYLYFSVCLGLFWRLGPSFGPVWASFGHPLGVIWGLFEHSLDLQKCTKCQEHPLPHFLSNLGRPRVPTAGPQRTQKRPQICKMRPRCAKNDPKCRL